MAKSKSFDNYVLALLDGKKYKALKEIYSSMRPFDIAEHFENLPQMNVLLLFRILPKDIAADTFVEMESELQEALIQGFSDMELAEIVDELYIDDMVGIIEEMPANVVARILKHSSNQTRFLINEILQYPEDSAGSIMTTEFITLRPNMTVAESIKRIRERGINSETIDICYVTDELRKLIGTVTIRTIIISDESERIVDVMERNTISVNTTEDQETAVYLFSKYDLTVLPVVDKETRLVGIVTVDDAIDVMEQEASEDIAKMTAITPSIKPYLKETVFETYRARIPWLLLLMISATFTALIISHYENALKAYVILTAYIPMLMDTGGNSGSQSAVTIIRGLSIHDLEFGDLPRVLWKEFRVAILTGFTIAAVNLVKLIFLDRVGLTMAFIICSTLLLTVLVAKIVGCVLPLLAEKVGFDPTVMASPFITTIVDALSLLIYFGISSALLPI